MARLMNRLSARAVATLKRPGYHPDGGGLYLQVSPSLTRSWVYRYTLNGRAREMGLGSATIVPLAGTTVNVERDGKLVEILREGARDLADAARSLVRKGIDPIDERDARIAATAAAAPSTVLTFEQAAKKCMEMRKAEWRSDEHRDQWESSLRRYAYPVLGKLPVDRVNTEDVLRVLRPHWATKTVTMTRVRSRIERVLAWATSNGYRSGDNPARWDNHIDELLPKPTKLHEVKHHKAMPYANVPGLMSKLIADGTSAAHFLAFSILTGARSGETRGATWAEIDLDARTWSVPKERMKANVRHVVPLSAPAIKLLKSLTRNAESDLLFTSARNNPISDQALGILLERMKADCVPHGFRSSFKDWSTERKMDRLATEFCLAHKLPDAVEGAYLRSTMFDERRKIMSAWGSFLDGKVAAKVTPIRGAA